MNDTRAASPLGNVDETLTMLPTRAFRDRFGRGGYWWTWNITQTIAAYLARRAIRLGLRPNPISVLAAAVGGAASLLVMVGYSLAPWVAAFVGFLGWQLAYALDYTDGQVARATGSASPQGGILDLLCDYFVHTAVALAGLYVGTANWDSRWASVFAVLVASGWLFSPVYSATLAIANLASPATPLVRRFWLGRMLRQGRDYGIHIAALSLAMLIGGWAVLIVLGVSAAWNLAFLAVAIYAAAVRQDNKR